jgi:hypothetical protein
VRIGWTRTARVTGALSELVNLSLPPATKLNVSPPAMPWGYTGWILYVGTSPTQAWLQTEGPVGPGSTWVEPDSGLRTDLSNWPVQTPDLYVENRREILRG